MRRVVVTGMGVVSPLGRGVQHNWDALMAGKSGIRKIDDVDLKDIPVQIAGRVPFGENEPDFNPDTVVAPKDQKKNDKFILYGIAAASDAVRDSGWDYENASEEEQYRAGVMMGSGIGGLQGIYENSLMFNEFGMKKISPFFIPSVLINLISGNVSIKYGLKGPNHACVTACSTGKTVFFSIIPLKQCLHFILHNKVGFIVKAISFFIHLSLQSVVKTAITIF